MSEWEGGIRPSDLGILSSSVHHATHSDTAARSHKKCKASHLGKWSSWQCCTCGFKSNPLSTTQPTHASL